MSNCQDRDTSYLLEKTVKDLLQISLRKTEQDVRRECGSLARELIEASTRVRAQGEPLEQDSVLLPTESMNRLRDMVSQGNITSVTEGSQVIRAVFVKIFEDGQKNFGRIFVCLALIVNVVQKVVPEGPGQEEMLLLTDCVTDCLVQLRQACDHCQSKKWGSMTAVATGMFFMAAAMLGIIILK
ncbi:hypothetical protein chiPu_0005300 [Chiloscyllium punctatum]|uniref:Uncharacterized protein n=1 Tax=Chiloscyllium punctatum TaxID=137246 RepID=A0A401S965_CHIPU|nr:hypothetical protein [Chiloscyllium punctatum]